MNPTPKCSSCDQALCGLIYIDGKPFCDVCVRKRLADRDREITELKATIESLKSGLAESQMGDTVAEQAYRITCLEEALDRQLRWLNLAVVQAEAIRTIWSPKPPSAEAKPDPIQAVYERFKHLDRLLCEINDEEEDFRKSAVAAVIETAAALWLAVKAKVEGLGK